MEKNPVCVEKNPMKMEICFAWIHTMQRFQMRTDIASTSGSGRRSAGDCDRKDYCPIAWLPPGHNPGPDGGVATSARQRAFRALGHFGSKTRPHGRGEVTWEATRPMAGQRRAAQAEVATRITQSDSAPVAQASLSWTRDSGVASGRSPGCRPCAVTAVTKPAAT
jgi:hypothetical protein